MMNRTIGLLGGGQLGQMLCEAANSLGINIVVLDGENCPAKQVNARVTHINGSYKDASMIRELASRVDILTVESEHVDTFALENIANDGLFVPAKNNECRVKKVNVQPSWRAIRIIQDKFLQKLHFTNNHVTTVESKSVCAQPAELEKIGQEFGFPFMLKARKGAYDGRGNFPVRTSSDIPDALEALKGNSLYVEKWVDFKMELAVMVAKYDEDMSSDGKGTIAYPTVETVHEDSVCKLVYAPARGVSKEILQEAQILARRAAGCQHGRGIFGVEMFLTKDGQLLVNEIAPRPHNSGHYTIEACPTLSQFKAHLLCVLGIMPSSPDHIITPSVPATIMLNILGGARNNSHHEIVKKAVAIPSAALHMYGKESRPGRKIGHVTVVSKTMSHAEETIAPLISLVNEVRAERKRI